MPSRRPSPSTAAADSDSLCSLPAGPVPPPRQLELARSLASCASPPASASGHSWQMSGGTNVNTPAAKYWPSAIAGKSPSGRDAGDPSDVDSTHFNTTILSTQRLHFLGNIDAGLTDTKFSTLEVLHVLNLVLQSSSCRKLVLHVVVPD